METAQELNEEARVAAERGETARAERLYISAIELAPEWSQPVYNLGLLYKYAGRWGESLKWNLRAGELAPEDQAAHWNAGIAATALGKWAEARAAWTRAGLSLPDAEDGEPTWDFGLVPVRVCLEHSPEVLWSRRICPARAVIRNVPLPEADRGFGDVVLHDGAPSGYRTRQGREVPVFNELAVLKASRLSTWGVVLESPGPGDCAALEEQFSERGGAAEDWSTIRTLCKACSEDRPHERHDEDLAGDRWVPRREWGVAARDEELLARGLALWTSGGRGRRVLSTELLRRPPN